jgi:bifunctional DNase/RNase
MSEEEELGFIPDPDLPEKDLLEARLDSISVTNVGFILFLKVIEDARVLPIFIGANEAQSIALALNEESSPRPLTHDLMKAMLESLETSVRRVEIQDIREGTFYGRVFLERAGFEELDFDARPSDAIALALRWEAPIFVSRKVFEDAAVPVAAAVEETESEPAAEDSDEWVEASLSPEAEIARTEEHPLSPAEKLRGELDAALRDERYEEAARLRDAIKKLSLGN